MDSIGGVLVRIKSVCVFLAVLLLFAFGCSRNDAEDDVALIPSLGERNVVITETDIAGSYALPNFKGMKNEVAQQGINEVVMSFVSGDEVRDRRSTATGLLSDTDVSEHSFYEYGSYKVYCNDGEYLSFYLSAEQRFILKDSTLFVRQNVVHNYDAVSGRAVDLSTLFRSREEVSEYIAERLYERLLVMDCLSSESYSDAVFKDNILDYCAIVSENKIAVVTTSGKFNLKLSAGAPCIEISIPDEYYIKSN